MGINEGETVSDVDDNETPEPFSEQIQTHFDKTATSLKYNAHTAYPFPVV